VSLERVPWIVEHALTKPLDPAIARAGLGAGEGEAISLALELDADRVIIDELAGRSLAQHLGLPLIGTLGILLVAKRRSLIPPSASQ
jgi:predicted nucleic acid-binding protein